MITSIEENALAMHYRIVSEEPRLCILGAPQGTQTLHLGSAFRQQLPVVLTLFMSWDVHSN